MCRHSPQGSPRATCRASAGCYAPPGSGDDVWFPDCAVELQARPNSAGFRPTTSTLTLKGKKEVRPGFEVPEYAITAGSISGSSSWTSEAPMLSVTNVLGALDLTAKAKGYASFQQSVAATDLHKYQDRPQRRARVLVVLRRK